MVDSVVNLAAGAPNSAKFRGGVGEVTQDLGSFLKGSTF